jgi:hypothetical protein
MAMISVGYPADISTLSGDILARETVARTRKPLSELFFDASWGQGVKDVI